MNDKELWISASILVKDVEQSIELYVNKWKLFSVVNFGGSGESASAILKYRDPITKFRLYLTQDPDQRDTNGRQIPSGRFSRLSLPKTDFWEWVDDVFKDPSIVESTPWNANVILPDPSGHMFVVYTIESPPLK